MLRLDPVPGTGAGRVLVFLPGFMSAAASYRMLLEPLTAHGVSVVVPQLYRRGPAVLTGRFTVSDEAVAAVAVLRTEATAPDQAPGDEVRGDGACPRRQVFLGGHSRGGQAAWRAANLLATSGGPGDAELLSGLVVVDPVDGDGRRPSVPAATATPAAFTCPCLVVGAGIEGRCAPEPVNHRVFAAAAPAARHVVVDTIGHGDVLDDRPAASARRLCGGAPDPRPGRSTVTELIAALVLIDP